MSKKKKVSNEDERTYFSDGFDTSADTEDALMDTGDDFADASFDAALIANISDIFSTFANDDSSLFCGDEGSQRQDVVHNW